LSQSCNIKSEKATYLGSSSSRPRTLDAGCTAAAAGDYAGYVYIAIQGDPFHVIHLLEK